MNMIMDMDDDSLRPQIERLQLQYVHAIDDNELERWPEFFVDPCFYQITARDNFDEGHDLGVMRYESVGMLRDQVTATRHSAVFAPRYIRHVLGGTLIVARNDDAVETSTNVAIYQTSADGDTLLLMAAHYRDIIVATKDGLRFSQKQVIYDTLRLPDSIVYPL
jgi:anthranilate 1,2-dioxygenase small subunit